MIEIEIKVRVSDLPAARERLVQLGATVAKERHLEDNTLYDFPDGTLKAGRRALRLRTAGKRTILTFKGEPQKSRRFKIRPEFETEVRDGKQARKILQALGLSPVFRYVKKRTILRKGRVTICLDELAIGAFIELEGERQHIARLAEQLGIPSTEWIRKDYIQMLIEAGFPKGTAHSSERSSPGSASGSSSNSAPSS
jgi:adenylate cyclase class 2